MSVREKDYTPLVLRERSTPGARQGSSRARAWPPTVAILLCVALAAGAFVAFVAGDVVWRPALGEAAGFSPIDSAAIQEVWPAVGTTRGPGATLAMASNRAVGAVAGGPVSGAAAVLAGLAVVAVTFLFIRGLGGGSLAAGAGALALAFGGLFWSRVTGEQLAPVAALAGLFALAGLWRWSIRGAPLPLVGGGAAFALALAVHPSAIAAVPALLAFVFWQRPLRRWPAALVLLGAAAAGASMAISELDGLRTADWLLAPTSRAFAQRLAELGGVLAADFGPLGLCFLAVGAIALGRDRPATLLLFGGWALSVLAATLHWAAPDWRGELLPALVPGWILVGVGLHWFFVTYGERRPLVAAALVLALPALGFAAHFQTAASARAATTVVDRYLNELATVLPQTPVVLAEGGPLDRAVARNEASDLGWSRIAQDPVVLDEHLDSGRLVVGFAGARANLEALGFRFRPVGDAGIPMTLDEVIRTVPIGWTVAIAAGPGLARALPPGNRPTFAAVGGRANLFGTRRMRYALVGVRGGAAIEQIDAVEASIDLPAGEPVGRRRTPAALTATSDAQGAAVYLSGSRVAGTATGIALAIVTPQGDLAAAYQIEADDGLQFRVDPRSLRAGALAGREPCAELETGAWVDATEPVGYGGLGLVLPPKARLQVYVASLRRLHPRQARLRHRSVPDLAVRSFEGERDREMLEAAFAGDGVEGGALRSYPYVYRIEASSRPRRSTQLALRLGGFGEIALARLSSAARPARACAAMRGGAGLFARLAAGATADQVRMEDDDLFVNGWERAERIGSSVLRWTNRDEAQLLLPLARAAAVTLEFEVRSLAAGATLGVRVNDVELAPIPISSDIGVVRWEVPAGAWRAGMNRLWVRVDRLARPSDLYGVVDDRLLGVAVEAVRLRLARTETLGDPEGRR